MAEAITTNTLQSASIAKLNRRDFLKLSGTASSGLVLSMNSLPSLSAEQKSLSPSFWLNIESDGKITLWNKRAEMGQGTRSTIAMILAEELDADWDAVRIEQAATEEQFGHIIIGGSYGIQSSWQLFREVGATARTMLLSAASHVLKVPESELITRQSQIYHQSSGRQLTYGQLVEIAADLPVPRKIKLKTHDDYRLFNQPGIKRKELDDIVTGQAQYGMDLKLPGMQYAAIARSPVIGGKVAKYDASKALAIKGVQKIIPIKGSGFPHYNHIREGIAVVADSTWIAFKARDLLDIEWSFDDKNLVDEERLQAAYQEALLKPGKTGREIGSIENVQQSADEVMTAEYELPFWAHAPLETMNATAQFDGDKLSIWTPTQRQTRLQEAVAKLFDLPKFSVMVYTPLLGGSFGRRLDVDYGIEAALIAKEVIYPVQLVWTREEEIQFSLYRSSSRHQLTATFANEQLTGVDIKASHLSVWQQQEPDMMDKGFDWAAASSAIAWPYGGKNFRYSQHLVEAPIPVSWWRGVYGTNNTLVQECWIDEIAERLKRDPIGFRLEQIASQETEITLPDHPEFGDKKLNLKRLARLIEFSKTQSNWKKRIASGELLGFASDCYDGRTFVAVIAKAKKTSQGVVFDKVDCFIDCGFALNIDNIKAQFEGGVIWSLSAIQSEVTITDGRVNESNFHDYSPLRMHQVPEIKVTIMPSKSDPKGVGEPVVTATLPALVNAASRAIGKRIRKLPIKLA